MSLPNKEQKAATVKLGERSPKMFELPGMHSDVVNIQSYQKKVCIGVPTTGLMRIEWVLSRFGCIMPCNWSHGEIFQFFDQYSPVDYVVADARNIVVQYCLSNGFEWLLFIDHDTCIPPDTFLRMGEHMREAKYPIVGGLYYCKGSFPEPLIYRGRGNGYFDRWKFGEQVECDGLPMGCTLIHSSILKYMADNSETYVVPSQLGPVVVRRVFQTPRITDQDPETGKYNSFGGTEDLPFFDRLMMENVLTKTGWTDVGKKKYQFLCDTNIFCQHIDNMGVKYPGLMYRNSKQYVGSKLEEAEKKAMYKKPVATSAGSQY